jgi:ribonucleoside-triphosphate reductase
MQVMTKPITLAPAFIAEVKKKLNRIGVSLAGSLISVLMLGGCQMLKRTENWDETVKRVVEGNINLDPRLHTANPDPKVVERHCKKKHGIFSN